MKLVDLTTPAGIYALVQGTGGTKSFYNHPEQAQQVQQVVAAAIARRPTLADVSVRIAPNYPNAAYHYDKQEIVLGVVNPTALEHELAHVGNIMPGGLYEKILKAAQGVSRLSALLAVPTTLALRAFMRDPDKRNDILNSLAALSAAGVTPELLEEGSASAQAVAHSPDRKAALKTLAPAYMAHLARNVAPSMIYQAGRFIP